MLADESIYVSIVEAHVGIRNQSRIFILYFHRNLTASQLLAEDSSLLQSIDKTIRVDATLETETGIGAQAMTTCALANPCRVEISALQNHVACGFVGATTLAAKDTSDTHRLLGIADAKVVESELMVFAIESCEVCALRLSAHNNLVALYHVSIETMHRLTIRHHHIVGDVDDVVDRTNADDVELILKPLWTFLNFAVGDRDACIALASLCVLNLHIDVEVVVVDNKLVAIRTMQRCLIAILQEPSIEVASHTIMAESISTVGCNINLYYPVAFKMIVFGSRHSDLSILRQYDDAIVRGANTDFVFGTNHAKTLYATKLRFFDYEFLVTIIEHAAKVGNDNFLTSSNIRSATNNLLWFALAEVDCGNM